MLEDEVFEKYKVNFDKLKIYGFKKIDNSFYFTKKFLNSNFKTLIKVDENGKVTGRIFDLDLNEEYFNFRVDGAYGEFVNKVREEYKNILTIIAENCFDKQNFAFEQSNRIAKLIEEKYGVVPEFLWKKFDDNAIFRNFKTKKWFGAILGVDRSKIQNCGKGKVEVLDLKLDNLVQEYLKNNGIYEGYHFNKKNWIAIILDDTLSDNEIMNLVKISYNLVD